MKKLQTLFSPKKLIVWIFVFILIVTSSNFSKPAMSRVEAIVTMLFVERVEDKTEIATVVLGAGEGRNPSYQIYSSNGNTLADATSKLAEMLGKELGFAQCEIIGFGDEIRQDGVMADLDFLIRTRKTSGNSVVIAFSGDTKEFAESITDLGVKKGLKFEEVINNDKHFAYSKDSKLDSFFKEYFGQNSLGIMPYVRLEKEEKIEAIEVQASPADAGGKSGEQEKEKKYIVNDGTAVILKKGVEKFRVEPQMCEKINLFLQEAQIDLLKVDNVLDDLYDDESIVFRIEKKKIKFNPKFENNEPVFNVKIKTMVRIEEVVKNKPNEKFLIRNKDFLTEEAVKKFKEKVESVFNESVNYCIENEFDILGVYEQFNAKCNTKFKTLLNENNNQYLDKVKYNIDVEVNSID